MQTTRTSLARRLAGIAGAGWMRLTSKVQGEAHVKSNILVLAAMAAIATVADGAKAGPRRGAEPEAVLKLEPYRRGVAVRVEANGKPGLFVFDSAAGVTVLSPAFAKRAGCTPWG